jgi:hypothetical protein
MISVDDFLVGIYYRTNRDKIDNLYWSREIKYICGMGKGYW